MTLVFGEQKFQIGISLGYYFPIQGERLTNFRICINHLCSNAFILRQF